MDHHGLYYKLVARIDRAMAAAAVIGFLVGMVLEWYRALIVELALVALSAFGAWVDWPSVLIGMSGGLFFYLWRVTDGEPFQCVKALLHTFLGSFFGWLGAKVATGIGANDAMQTAAAGIVGGTGPKALDRFGDNLGARR